MEQYEYMHLNDDFPAKAFGFLVQTILIKTVRAYDLQGCNFFAIRPTSKACVQVPVPLNLFVSIRKGTDCVDKSYREHKLITVKTMDLLRCIFPSLFITFSRSMEVFKSMISGFA